MGQRFGSNARKEPVKMNFSIEGIDNVVDKLTQYATGVKMQRGLAMAAKS